MTGRLKVVWGIVVLTILFFLSPVLLLLGRIAVYEVVEGQRVATAEAFVKPRGGWVDYDTGHLELYLSHAGIKDVDLRRIVEFDPDGLWLDGNPQITDVGLSILKSCQDLKWVSVRKTAVTPQGVREVTLADSGRRLEVIHSTIDLTVNGDSPEMRAAARTINNHYIGVTTNDEGVVVELKFDRHAVEAGDLKLAKLFPSLERVRTPE